MKNIRKNKYSDSESNYDQQLCNCCGQQLHKKTCLATVVSKESSEMLLTRNFVTAKSFSVPLMVQMLSSYVMIDGKPDVIVIHIGTNDIFNHANHEDIELIFINIELDCKNNGANKVFISSIFLKKNPNKTAIVH